jgi:hypothetical protein
MLKMLKIKKKKLKIKTKKNVSNLVKSLYSCDDELQKMLKMLKNLKIEKRKPKNVLQNI